MRKELKSGIPEFDDAVEKFENGEMDFVELTSYLWNTAYSVGQREKPVMDDATIMEDAAIRFDPKHSWEYNLMHQVRWGSEDAKDDVCFYVQKWLRIIASQEGYMLKKQL